MKMPLMFGFPMPSGPPMYVLTSQSCSDLLRWSNTYSPQGIVPQSHNCLQNCVGLGLPSKVGWYFSTPGSQVGGGFATAQ